MTTDTERLAVARKFFGALSDGDWATVRSLTADEFVMGDADLSPDQLLDAFGDGEWDRAAPLLGAHFAPGGDEITSERFVEERRAWQEHHTEDYRLEDISVEAGRRVVYLATVTETHDGMYHGYAPTGEDITIMELGVLQVDSGIITEYRQSTDTWAFFTQMGILPGGPTRAKVQKQFEKVVNRVLRHNLRNDLNMIDSYADLFGDQGGDAACYAGGIRATAGDLIETVEKIRTIERQVLTLTEVHQIDLGDVVRSVVAEQREAYPDSTLEVTVPAESLSVTSSETLVTLALEEAIENAAKHVNGNPHVEVTLEPARSDEHVATITIADDGTGIPTHEVNPLDQDRETPLEHASGVGLWAIKWGVERLRGEVEFGDADRQGGVVRFHLSDTPPEAVD